MLGKPIAKTESYLADASSKCPHFFLMKQRYEIKYKYMECDSDSGMQSGNVTTAIGVWSMYRWSGLVYFKDFVVLMMLTFYWERYKQKQKSEA